MNAPVAPQHDPRRAAYPLAAACGPVGAWIALQSGLGLRPAACGMAGLLTLLVVAPVVEEIVFRLGLHAWLARKLPKNAGLFGAANLLTALAFGAMHAARQQSALMLLTALPACLIGWVWILGNDRLGPAILLHAWYNGCIAYASCH